MKNLISLVLVSYMLIPTLLHACWPLDERKEIEGFSELDDILILSFKDAIDCKAITNATVTINNQEFETDYRGYLELPMGPFAEIMDEARPIKVKGHGYITLETDLRIEAGTVLNRRLVMSRVLPPGKIRFVLQWSEEPNDLDLHLTGSSFHISYRHMKSIANKADLDRDALNGYGPETITLHQLDESEKYGVWVDNYSNDAAFTGNENLTIYVGNKLLHAIQLKKGFQRAIHILDIDRGNFQILNKPSNRP